MKIIIACLMSGFAAWMMTPYHIPDSKFVTIAFLFVMAGSITMYRRDQ